MIVSYPWQQAVRRHFLHRMEFWTKTHNWRRKTKPSKRKKTAYDQNKSKRTRDKRNNSKRTSSTTTKVVPCSCGSCLFLDSLFASLCYPFKPSRSSFFFFLFPSSSRSGKTALTSLVCYGLLSEFILYN